jgi:hypothetical protein
MSENTEKYMPLIFSVSHRLSENWDQITEDMKSREEPIKVVISLEMGMDPGGVIGADMSIKWDLKTTRKLDYPTAVFDPNQPDLFKEMD